MQNFPYMIHFSNLPTIWLLSFHLIFYWFRDLTLLQCYLKFRKIIQKSWNIYWNSQIRWIITKTPFKIFQIKKICPLRGHILIARFACSALRSQVWARLGRAIRSSRCALRNFWTSRFALRSFWASRFALGLVLFACIQVYFL